MKLFLLSLYFASFASVMWFILDNWGSFLIRGIETGSWEVQKKLEKEFIWVPSRAIFIAFILIIAITVITLLSSQNKTTTLFLPPLLIGILYILFRLFTRFRKKRVLKQIPFFLDLLDSYIKAGISLPQALHEISGKVKSPIKEEVKIVTGNLKIGLPMDEALRSLYERAPAEETLITFLSISTCMSNGSNMSELISKIRYALVEKQRAEEKIRTRTSQGRLQGIVLTFVPILLVLALQTLLPGYIQSLTSAPAGKLILALSSTLLFIGWITIFKIIKPEV